VPDKPRSIWLRKERSGRGPTPEHGRAQIAAAAIELADASGIDAVTTRKVAAAIGAGATSLYRYVANRDELLELMLDAAIGQLDLSRPVTGDWRRDLSELAGQMRSMYRAHPWLLDIAQAQTSLTPNSVDFLEYVLSALADVDAPGRAKMEAVAMLNGMVVLHARMELAGDRTSPEWQAAQVEYLTAVVAGGGHPHLAAVIASPPPPEPAAASDGAELLDRLLLHVLSGLLSET